MAKTCLVFSQGQAFVLFLVAAFGIGTVLAVLPWEDQPELRLHIVAPRIVLEHQLAVRSLAFSRDGKSLVTAGGFRDLPGEIKLWDPLTDTERATLRGSQNGIHSVAFSPDGRTLATASFDQQVALWEVDTGRERASFPVPFGNSVCTVLAPDGQTMALTGWARDPGRVLLWRLPAKSNRPLTASSGPATFSADGRRLTLWRLATDPQPTAINPLDRQRFPLDVTLAASPAVEVCDLAIGQEALSLRGDRSFVWALALSPDGSRLASGGFDDTVKLWDVATGQERAALRGHTDQVGAVAFAPDGRLLASGSHDGTVKLWDAATGRELVTLRGHTGTVTAVAFSPDGRCVASASHDRTVRLWRLARDW
jgi:WD40 repeat protein